MGLQQIFARLRDLFSGDRNDVWVEPSNVVTRAATEYAVSLPPEPVAAPTPPAAAPEPPRAAPALPATSEAEQPVAAPQSEEAGAAAPERKRFRPWRAA
jgi:hypothetical protein